MEENIKEAGDPEELCFSLCGNYGRRRRNQEEELCIEIRPTKIHIPQSKIRPDFIPNLVKNNFTSLY
jgi:hypothetical protein